MANPAQFFNGIFVVGDVTITDDFITDTNIKSTAAIARSKLAQDALAKYTIQPTDLRVWDDLSSLLPATSATDDLGLADGTFGTDFPSVQTSDLKAAGATTRYARFMFALPPEYDAGQTIEIRAHAGMLTTVADVTATIDFECYQSDEEAGIVGPTDLVTTAATTINSVTLADIDFTLTPTTLVAGDILDIRMAIAINDAATGTAVIGIVGALKMQFDIRG
jgi:hypothetical protein